MTTEEIRLLDVSTRKIAAAIAFIACRSTASVGVSVSNLSPAKRISGCSGSTWRLRWKTLPVLGIFRPGWGCFRVNIQAEAKTDQRAFI
jgi:hypothetical protein